jgi:hypothetical protein
MAQARTASSQSILRHPWIQQVLPFLTSLSLHASVALIGVLFFMGARYVRHAAPHIDQVTIPSAWLDDERAPVMSSAGPLGLDPQRRAMQDRIRDVETPDGWANRKGPRVHFEQGGGSGDSADETIALGPGGGFGKGVTGRGIGPGTGPGLGSDSGPLLPFGTPGGGNNAGAMFPKDPARRIVYVCDASGSMLEKFDTLKRELSKAVHHLDPIQSFDVIFFQEQNCRRVSDQLIMATPDNKTRADRFLDTIIPRAETNPIPALQLAFRQKPDLIYLLTDGDFPHNQAVLDCIARYNQGKRIRINTIAFVGGRDKDMEFTELLKQIAKESGGTYRFLRDRDF